MPPVHDPELRVEEDDSLDELTRYCNIASTGYSLFFETASNEELLTEARSCKFALGEIPVEKSVDVRSGFPIRSVSDPTRLFPVGPLGEHMEPP